MAAVDEDVEILAMALAAVYDHVSTAIDMLQSGEQKEAILRLRQCLPQGHVHSLHKSKNQ